MEKSDSKSHTCVQTRQFICGKCPVLVCAECVLEHYKLCERQVFFSTVDKETRDEVSCGEACTQDQDRLSLDSGLQSKSISQSA